MTTEQFDQMRIDFCEARFEEADHKAISYATHTDRLVNFKRQAARWGVSPLQVAGIYWGKHIDAVESYIREGIESKDGIESNLGDAANYIELILGLIREVGR